jgi:hypothetical protein
MKTIKHKSIDISTDKDRMLHLKPARFHGEMKQAGRF